MKKFFKKYAMTLVALLIASVTLMSFEMAQNSSNAIENEYWFEMDLAGTTPLSGALVDIDEICPSQVETPNCARLYKESQTTGTGSSRTVLSGEINKHQDFRTRD